MSEFVTLAPWEVELARYGADQRALTARRHRTRDKYGANTAEGGFDLHYPGMLGELAVAKYLNLAWTGGWGDYETIDVGGCVEVRATERTANYSLILHDDDDGALPFVLAVVNVKSPVVELVGWRRALHGKRGEYFRKGARPAYFVPVSVLEPMRALWHRPSVLAS